MRTTPSKNSRSTRAEKTISNSVIVAFEGYSTEPKYFKKIKESKLFPGSRIELVPLWRDFSEIGNSHPLLVVEYLKDNQSWINSKGNKCPVNLFLTKYLHTVARKYAALKEEFYPEQQNEGLRFNPKFEYLEETKKCLRDELRGKNKIDSEEMVDIDEAIPILNAVMKSRHSDYSFDGEVTAHSILFKKPCNFGRNQFVMVVDRDQQSFSIEDVERVMSTCSNNGYHLIVSNPNFELWLAMHFKDYRREEMLECIQEMAELKYDAGKTKKQLKGRAPGPIEYLEKIHPGYKKNEDFEWVGRNGVARAIENSKELCTKLDGLVGEIRSDDLSAVGTNMAELFELLSGEKSYWIDCKTTPRGITTRRSR